MIGSAINFLMILPMASFYPTSGYTRGMVSVGFIALVSLALTLLVLAAAGPRVAGYGSLLIGLFGLIYTFGGNVPGYLPLMLIPACALLMLMGGILLVAGRFQTRDKHDR